MSKRFSWNAKESFLHFLRGLCMGAADAVPGVSGGTIAFITGIYERLVGSIASVTLLAKRVWHKELRFGDAFMHIDWQLFVPLGLGILLSLYLFSGIMVFLLEAHTALLFAFFLGLIVASAMLLLRQTKRSLWSTLFIVLGVLIAVSLNAASAILLGTSLISVFFAAIIAISAMILPGISGAFLLLLLGQYEFLVTALHELDLAVIASFGFGAVVGLLSFSHLLSYLLKKHHDEMLSVLTGLMLGSLYVPLRQVASNLAQSSLFLVLAAALVGFIFVFGLERYFSGRKTVAA